MLIIWVEGQESFHMNVEWIDLQKALQGPSDSPAWYREIVCLHLLNLLRSESGDVQDLLRLLQTHPSDARGCSRLLTWTAPGLRCCLTGCERRHNTTYISLQADLEDVTYDNRITNDNSVIIYISNNVYIVLKKISWRHGSYLHILAARHEQMLVPPPAPPSQWSGRDT